MKLNYKEIQNFLNNLELLGMKFGFERINSLLASIDNPHQKYKTILIAGTNGKGSTATMIAAIMKESGIRVGLYTSPHIENFRERIRLNGEPVSEARVTILVNKLFSLSMINTQSKYPTYFEFMTMLAFFYFAEENVDIAVLEVGMGGRLDATNVVDPLVSVITEIDFDHSAFLGETLTAIAREKGGIIKPNGQVVLSSKKREVINQISEMCKNANSSLYIRGKDYYGKRIKKTETCQTMNFENSEYTLDSLQISLTGSHQINNAASAIKTVLLLNKSGFTISGQNIRNALRKIKMEGRLELINKKPYIILDMAHNPNAAKSLAKSLSEDFNYENLYIVIGIMKDKDIKNIMTAIAPIANTIFLTRPQTDRSAPLALMKTVLNSYSVNVRAINNVSAAMTEALSCVREKDLLCVTGSCYTVGEARLFLKGANKNNAKN